MRTFNNKEVEDAETVKVSLAGCAATCGATW